jgi:hypothetical protein
MGKQPVEIFMPPNVLKAKVGVAGGLDVSAVRRAELAVEELKEEFAGWMFEDVTRLVNAKAAYEVNRTSDTLGALYRASHDLKGQGQTFDFPLVARIASSLCKLSDVEGGGEKLPMHLIDAHVNAIKIIVRDGIKDLNDPIATMLARELERQVAEYQD